MTDNPIPVSQADVPTDEDWEAARCAWNTLADGPNEWEHLSEAEQETLAISFARHRQQAVAAERERCAGIADEIHRTSDPRNPLKNEWLSDLNIGRAAAADEIATSIRTPNESAS